MKLDKRLYESDSDSDVDSDSDSDLKGGKDDFVEEVYHLNLATLEWTAGEITLEESAPEVDDLPHADN